MIKFKYISIFHNIHYATNRLIRKLNGVTITARLQKNIGQCVFKEKKWDSD